MKGARAKAPKKNSKAFKEARSCYVKLLGESSDLDILRRGIFEFGEHKGECLGITSQKIIDAKLPMPFGCPDLFVQPCEGGGIIWFCDRVGCICVCCREDFKEKYPDYCPSREEFFADDYDPDFDDTYWEEDLYE